MFQTTNQVCFFRLASVKSSLKCKWITGMWWSGSMDKRKNSSVSSCEDIADAAGTLQCSLGVGFGTSIQQTYGDMVIWWYVFGETSTFRRTKQNKTIAGHCLLGYIWLFLEFHVNVIAPAMPALEAPPFRSLPVSCPCSMACQAFSRYSFLAPQLCMLTCKITQTNSSSRYIALGSISSFPKWPFMSGHPWISWDARID